MTIYIATTIAGRGVRHVTWFRNKAELVRYAQEVLSMTDHPMPTPRTTIEAITDLLDDRGIGSGARYHRHVRRAEALRLIRAGAEATDCHDIP